MARKNSAGSRFTRAANTATAADPERLRARLELRRSSAAQRHVPKTRKGTRAAARRRAISAGW